MRRHRGWLSGLLVLAVAGGVWAQGLGPSGDAGRAQEDQVKAALERFSKEYAEGMKKKDETMRLQALGYLDGLYNDQRVVDAVGKVLNTSTETVNVKTTAATKLGASANPKAVSILEKAFNANEKNDAVLEVVRQIGSIKDKTAVKALEKIIRPRINRFDDEKSINIATTGLNALGQLRFNESIETLLKLYEPAVSGKPEDPTTIPDGEREKETRRSSVEGALNAALTGLTAQPHQILNDWKQWWSKNKKTWKFE